MRARCSALEGGLAKATQEHIATSGYGSCVVLLRRGRGRGRRVAVRDMAKLQKTTPAPTAANQAKPSQPSQAKPSTSPVPAHLQGTEPRELRHVPSRALAGALPPHGADVTGANSALALRWTEPIQS